MAKTTNWQGGVSTDPDIAANWSNGVPVATDTAICVRTANRSIIPTSSWTAERLAKLKLNEGFRFDVGDVGNPLIVGAIEVIHRGSGSLFYEGSPTQATDSIIINADTPRGRSNGAAFIAGSGVLRVSASKGHIILAAGLATLDRLELHYRDNPLEDVFVDAVGATTSTVLLIAAGMLVSTAAYSNVEMSGGTFVQENSDIGTLNLSGGTLTFNTDGQIATAHLTGGTLDFTENPHEVLLRNLYKYPDGEFLRTDLTTVENEFDMTGSGN